VLFLRREPAAGVPGSEDGILARGESTTLRRFEREDVDRWLGWPRHVDPLFGSYNPPVLTPRQRDEYFQARMAAPDSVQYSVDDLAGELVGRVSLREINWRAGVSVLGISLHPGRLNQGFGTDCLQAFLGYYFGPLKMTALFLDVAAFNTRAYRVYEKCGFRRSGERWGEAQTDYAGVFRRLEYQGLRHLFLWDCGMMRPLLIDMVLRREDWARRVSRDHIPAPVAGR